MSTRLLPKTYSSRDIQRNYRNIFNEAKKSSPIVILTNNKPDVAIVDIHYLEAMQDKVRQVELEDTLEAIATYQKEKKQGKLKKLEKPEDLLKL